MREKNLGGRPRKPDARRVHIDLRVDDALLAAAREAAQAEQLPLAEWARRAIVDRLKRGPAGPVESALRRAGEPSA